MKQYSNTKPEQWADILKRPTFDFSELNDEVLNMLKNININGDAALIEYTKQFNNVEIDSLQVSESEILEAEGLLTEDLKLAIEKAAGNILTFHSRQSRDIQKVEVMPGVQCWQKTVAIEKIGLHVPGGLSPLFSTILMLAIPAKIAGCTEIILCTPPNENGKINPAILFAAKLTGIDKIYKLGGVQAIGAMAYGTQSIPKVYKIFGTGNKYVQAAKQLVGNKEVAIDMPAGSSELAIMADETAVPAFVASDLLSQAEHSEDSQVVLLANSEELVSSVWKELNIQLEQLPRKEIAIKALEHSLAIILDTEQEMIDVVNQYAPECLIISVKNYRQVAEKIINAGSVFLGNYTPESVGDYATGTNHILPTNGWSRAISGVNLDSFCKKITFQELTKEGIKNIGSAVEIMASTEMLEAHKNAVSIRLNFDEKEV